MKRERRARRRHRGRRTGTGAGGEGRLHPVWEWTWQRLWLLMAAGGGGGLGRQLACWGTPHTLPHCSHMTSRRGRGVALEPSGRTHVLVAGLRRKLGLETGVRPPAVAEGQWLCSEPRL